MTVDPVTEVNIVIRQGEDYPYVMQFEAGDVLTSNVFTMTAKETWDAPGNLFQVIATITGQVASFVVPRATTSALKPMTNAKYDIKRQYADNSVDFPVRGTLTVLATSKA